MGSPETATDLSSKLMGDLPFLRRYARALTGAQSTGDQYAIATLETIVADPSIIADDPSAKVGLFRIFHGIWASSGAPVADTTEPSPFLEERAQQRLAALTANSREALLLSTVEGFGFEAMAKIMDLSQDEAKELITRAKDEMADLVPGNILIIEDEGIIAMDLKSIVTDMGHTVTNVARTRDDAITKGLAKAPDLILADIQLADKSSGIDAVNALLGELGTRPVIFITAFPERLLTGERPEPAFLISKPYSQEEVRAAVSQAMFFASTAHMEIGA